MIKPGCFKNPVVKSLLRIDIYVQRNGTTSLEKLADEIRKACGNA